MTKLSDKDIVHVANLAKLDIKKEEIVKFKKQLSEVISYVDELSEVPTPQGKSSIRIVESENVFREDDAKPSLTQEEALSGSDNTNGYFVVDAVIKNE